MATGIVDNVLNAIRDRARNPLIGSFVICWLIVNYKTLLVIFGDGKYVEKIDYISKYIYPEFWNNVLLNLGYPLAGSVAYLIITIWPASWYYHWWYFAQKRISDKKKKLDGAVLLTKKESIALQSKYQSLENDYQKLKDSEEQQKGELLNRINKLEEDKNHLKTLLKLPIITHDSSNIKTKKTVGQLQNVIEPTENKESWRIEFSKEKSDKYGFEVILRFKSRNTMRFDSVYLDLQKFENKGLVEFQDSIGKVTMYEGEKNKTSHITGWIPLGRKIVSDRFSISIRGDAAEGWYQLNTLRFRDTTEQATDQSMGSVLDF